MTARVTLSATQGRQGEHDAKPGRKSRVASGSPKESEDLGMETIKGKPELVRNPRPPRPRLSHSRAARRAGIGSEGNGLPSGQVVPASPLPPRPTAAGRGRHSVLSDGPRSQCGRAGQAEPGGRCTWKSSHTQCAWETPSRPGNTLMGINWTDQGPDCLYACACVCTQAGRVTPGPAGSQVSQEPGGGKELGASSVT